jgi:hypothetical protein
LILLMVGVLLDTAPAQTLYRSRSRRGRWQRGAEGERRLHGVPTLPKDGTSYFAAGDSFRSAASDWQVASGIFPNVPIKRRPRYM